MKWQRSKRRQLYAGGMRMLKQTKRRVRKLVSLMRSGTYRRGLYEGVGAAIEHEGIMRSLVVGTLVDVGANKGQFSLLTRAHHPSAIIHAFEPLPGAANRYGRLFGRDANVHLYRCAAGDRAANVEMNVSAQDSSSSILPITEVQSRSFPGTEKVGTATIKLERVDEVLKNADLVDPIMIKLDVQGYELAALNGMPKTLSRAQYVYCEVSFRNFYEGQPMAHEIVAALGAKGFGIVGVGHLETDEVGASLQADFLFERSSTLSGCADSSGSPLLTSEA